jgi:hypothetical protein
MNGREYFHESVVKDIVDILTDLKDFDEVQFINNVNAKRSFKSITSATKDLILTFPVMVSTDIDPDNAIMIAKAQEKKMASLLHILFTAISVGNNEDVYDYVKKFHANVGSLDGSLDSYSAALDKLATTFGESYDATLKIDHAVLNSVLEDLKESNYVLPDNVNESSLESYKVVPGYRTGYKDMIIQEGKNKNGGNTIYTGDSMHSDSRDFSKTDNRNFSKTDNRDFSKTDNRDFSKNTTIDTQNVTAQMGDNSTYISNKTTGDYNQQEYMNAMGVLNDPNATDAEKKVARGVVDAYEKIMANRTDIASYTQRDNRAKAIRDLDNARYMESMTKAHNAMVLNNEYKKANELQPTMMVVNFMKHTEENGDYINTAVIGIKCKIYPISSADIVNRISGKLKDKSFLTNFVRATTNEIGFFRDFIFAIDQAKFDAKSYGKNAESNKLWKVLERRSIKSKFRRSLKMYNDATAISTLVMSENDAEYLKKVHSIDILNVSKARSIMDSYNFLCLVVANQSTEVASFLYDTGDDTFEMIPFSGLEREASDNSYKKMVNLMAKISR